MTTKRYLTLEDILGKNEDELVTLSQGELELDSLGTIPFTSIDHSEYKQIKKECVKMEPNGTGGMTPDVDEDKMMVRLIIQAVDKDTRSSFTFANKELLAKLGVKTADQAVNKLLKPGEIVNFAVAVQNASGFGAKAKKETEEAVKNS